MNKANFKSYLILIAGFILSITGVVLIIKYITEAVIERAGEPDQSLLFWYLPFLLIGFVSFVAGFFIIFYKIKSLKNRK